MSGAPVALIADRTTLGKPRLTTALSAKPVQTGDAKPQDPSRGSAGPPRPVPATGLESQQHMMKVAVMQQFSDYSYSAIQTQPKKKDRTGMAMATILVLFMLFGFLGGIGILLIRNAYLFS